MLVDVMVPAFGDDALVRQAVISVREQTDRNWRLTVLDDGPAAGRDPGLATWLAGLADRRIRYHAHRERLGINRNFQRCVEVSAADLVVILGADDRLLPDFVERVRRVAGEFPQAAFLHTGARVVNMRGVPAVPLADRVKRMSCVQVGRRGARQVGGEALAVSLLRGNWMYFPSVVFRRGWLVRHGFRPGYDVVLDLDLYLRILRDGGCAVLLDAPGIEYRRHSASVSSLAAYDGSRFVEERRFFAETAAELAKAGWPRAARAARLHLTSRLHALVKVPGLLAVGRLGVAAGLLRGALSPLAPLSPVSPELPRVAQPPRAIPDDDGPALFAALSVTHPEDTHPEDTDLVGTLGTGGAGGAVDPEVDADVMR